MSFCALSTANASTPNSHNMATRSSVAGHAQPRIAESSGGGVDGGSAEGARQEEAHFTSRACLRRLLLRRLSRRLAAIPFFKFCFD